jgi:hypothetical protein
MKTLQLVLLLTALSLFTGCATATKPSPFKVPRETIRESVKTVAIFHLKNHDPIEGEFTQLIGTKLREGGFRVIEPAAIAPWAAQEQKAVGGLYDPLTGKVVRAKEDLYWQNVLQGLHTNLGVDAIVLFGVVTRAVSYGGQGALSAVKWDGTSQSLFEGSKFAAFMRGGTHSGKARGYSLRITLQDLQRRVLFENFGGIQLASKLKAAALGPTQIEDIPRTELFQDPIRIQNAASLALDPLVKQPGAKP